MLLGTVPKLVRAYHPIIVSLDRRLMMKVNENSCMYVNQRAVHIGEDDRTMWVSKPKLVWKLITNGLYVSFTCSIRLWKRRTQGPAVPDHHKIRETDTLDSVYIVHLSNFKWFSVRVLSKLFESITILKNKFYKLTDTVTGSSSLECSYTTLN